MTIRTLIAVALASFPAVAHAQDDVNVDLEPMQFANTFAIGAGALGFMEVGFDPQDPAMPFWSVRYGWNPDPGITWEWAYHGTTDAFENPELPLVGTLFETGLKLNLGVDADAYPIVGFGIGYMAFEGVPRQTDFEMMTIPVLAGFEVVADSLVVDVRATWRPTFFDDGLNFTSVGADSWAVTADLGTRF